MDFRNTFDGDSRVREIMISSRSKTRKSSNSGLPFHRSSVQVKLPTPVSTKSVQLGYSLFQFNFTHIHIVRIEQVLSSMVYTLNPEISRLCITLCSWFNVINTDMTREFNPSSPRARIFAIVSYTSALRTADTFCFFFPRSFVSWSEISFSAFL